MMNAILVGLILSLASCAGQNFKCPKDNRFEICQPTVTGDYLLLGKGDSSLKILIGLDKVEVICLNNPNWSESIFGDSIDVGHIKTLVFRQCKPPGKDHNQQVKNFLGIEGVEQLEFNLFNGTLVHDNLAVYTDLKDLTITIYNNGTISFDLLKDMQSLLLLKLHNNTEIQLSVDFFNRLESLRTLELASNQLRYLEPRIFDGLHSLEKLNLSRNDIYVLDATVFHNLSNLQFLDVSFNKLKNLPDGIFKFNSKLQTLDLSNNHLKCINNKTLLGLGSLLKLNMENNHLTDIYINAFLQAQCLEYANFTNNTLMGYGNDWVNSPFRHCHSLKELYLAHNRINENHIDWIVNSTKLSKLDLRYNFLTYLNVEDIQLIPNEVHVDLRYNKIARVVVPDLKLLTNQTEDRNIDIDIRFNPMHCDCTVYDLVLYVKDQLDNAKNYVNFIMDDLNCVSPTHMRGLPVSVLNLSSLACLIEKKNFHEGDPCSPSGSCDCWERTLNKTLFLDCADRNLTEAPIRIDSGKYSEVELDLRNNKLTEVPSMYYKGYEKVTSVNLSGNRISSIDVKLLSPNLKTLLLDDNRLTTIDSKILTKLSNFTQITKLSLKNNPWSCECQSVDLLSFIHSKSKEMPGLQDLRCSNSNISLSELSTGEVCSSFAKTWSLFIVLSLLFCLLGLLLSFGIILCMRFRQRQKKVGL